jgi:anti-anti-sigma factor
VTATEVPSLSTRALPSRTREDVRTVVRLRGDHDMSTALALSVELFWAIAADDADLVVDLRDVQFMDAATVGVLIGARESLRPRGRSLTLRSLSSAAQRVIDVCDLEELVDR